MNKSKHSNGVVVITGDVMMDWNLARTHLLGEEMLEWGYGDYSRIYWQRGGAMLLANLIAATISSPGATNALNYEVRSVGAPREPVNPGDRRF